MSVAVHVRNESGHTGYHRRDALERIAARACRGEAVRGDVEVSVFFCNDAYIADLNRRYRHKSGPTDVLSFSQLDGKAGGDLPGSPRALGDIVISLDTVVTRCGDDAGRARAEVRLLFCHGLLHLLGYDHAGAAERHAMTAKQAAYLRIPASDAWIAERRAPAVRTAARPGRQATPFPARKPRAGKGGPK